MKLINGICTLRYENIFYLFELITSTSFYYKGRYYIRIFLVTSVRFNSIWLSYFRITNTLLSSFSSPAPKDNYSSQTSEASVSTLNSDVAFYKKIYAFISLSSKSTSNLNKLSSISYFYEKHRLITSMILSIKP